MSPFNFSCRKNKKHHFVQRTFSTDLWKQSDRIACSELLFSSGNTEFFQVLFIVIIYSFNKSKLNVHKITCYTSLEKKNTLPEYPVYWQEPSSFLNHARRILNTCSLLLEKQCESVLKMDNGRLKE